MTNTKNSSFTYFNFEGFKNLGIINCDSEWLWNYLRLLEWDSDVESYFQPRMWIIVEYARVEIEVKIDMWINYNSGKAYLVHFKNELDAIEEHPADNIDVQAACSRVCQLSNLHYYSVDQSVQEPEPRNSNVNLLWQHASRGVHPGQLSLVDRFFSEQPAPNIGKFKAALASCGYETDLVYTLLFHRALESEIVYFPLSDETPIFKGISKPSLLRTRMERELEELINPSFDSEVF